MHCKSLWIKASAKCINVNVNVNVWAALLSAVALRTLYFTHFKLFYFPNVIGLVQRIVRFVMRTEPKASYRTVQYEYAYRYTPNIYTVKG